MQSLSTVTGEKAEYVGMDVDRWEGRRAVEYVFVQVLF